VELLVVIGIIGLLAAIITPVVFRSLSTAKAAGVKAEIDMLHMALMNYKNEYGSLPPANMAGLWNGSSVNTNHPVYRHLQKLFPRLSEPTSGVQSPYLYMSQMSPAQALVFWLQGYFDDSQYPITNNATLSSTFTRAGSASGKRNKLFDFDETRLFAASVYYTAVSSPVVTPQSFSDRNSLTAGVFAREYPAYFPKLANASVPFTYFSSNAYSTPPSAGPVFQDLEYQAVDVSGAITVAYPYFSSQASPNDSWANCHQNPDSFQLISGGADGTYGAARASFPGALPFTTYGPSGVAFGNIPGLISLSGQDDNITNFAAGRLKEAAEKLLNQ
jgi:type II secretory pathway pseudopilin PulG